MKKRGFTIIEVVLVLAIAGLIFLMVFIALPALQRSQRNTRRRQDLARISTAFTQYLSSNSRLPMSDDGTTRKFDVSFVPHYIDENIVDSSSRSGFVSLEPNGKTKYTCPEGKTCDQFSDPDGSVYNIHFVGDVGSYDFSVSNANDFLNRDNFSEHLIYVVLSASCNNSGSSGYITESVGSNAFALAYILEGRAVYCVDNS